MATIVANLTGKGSNPKTTLYVGGLEDNVNEDILRAAFIPFGEVKDVSIPIDHATGTHRGFGFVEYEDKGDAGAAIDNMHNTELFGRVRAPRGPSYIFKHTNCLLHGRPPSIVDRCCVSIMHSP